MDHHPPSVLNQSLNSKFNLLDKLDDQLIFKIFSYCPEEDIVPPFAPAPAPPAELPLPVVPQFKVEVPEIPHEEYGPPPVPHEEYGPPHEEYGPPATVPPPPAIYYAPYPAVTTTTEVPTTTEALPPPPPIFYAPYPAATTTTEAPTTVFVRIAPYPAPTTPTPVVKEVKQYPGKVFSKYETDSGLIQSGGSSSGSFGDEVVVPEVPYVPSVIPAVRAPRHHYKKLAFFKPRLVFTKKYVSLPKVFVSKKKFIKW